MALAAQKIVELLNDDDPRIRLSAAVDILDRSGLKGPEIVQHEAGNKLASLLEKAIAPWGQGENEEGKHGEGRGTS